MLRVCEVLVDDT